MMSSEEPIQPIAELIERSLSIRHVYGEPVTQGETTVIPVAKVTYGFGAGGGNARPRRRSGAADAALPDDARTSLGGSGGGGAVTMSPLGVIEIGPQGTRFLRFRPWEPLLGAAALGLLLGWLVRRRGR
jgi:uncharacterized spore protein YtfJ